MNKGKSLGPPNIRKLLLVHQEKDMKKYLRTIMTDGIISK
jgi:hypothetical protein